MQDDSSSTLPLEEALTLKIRWVKPGPAEMPTVIAFTGFGHRLDPWQRLQPPGWRVGVVEFPIGYPPTQVWEPEALAAQVEGFWAKAEARTLLSFSFGAAGATAVANVMMNPAAQLHTPDFAAYVAPVQWARAPWKMLRALPRSARLKTLRVMAKGSGAVSPLVGRLGGPTVRQFNSMVDRYIGWEFVAKYLPYIDWIDSKKRTLAHWREHSWPTLVVAGSTDRVIPAEGLRALASTFGKVEYMEFPSQHFGALDRAHQLLNTRLAAVLAKKAVSVA